MANSRKTSPKAGTLTQFPAPDTALAVEDAPETDPQTPFDGDPPAETPPPAPPAARRGPNRPKEETGEPTFFQKVAAVPTADWGTRVYLYLYIIEPVCNLKQSGGRAYLMRYEEPITSEHPIMLEHGSGKYRFILAKNKFSMPTSEGQQVGGSIGMYDFEIFNQAYPPKVPREAWANDSKNRRWESLLPKPAPPPPASAASGLADFVEVLRATNEMRKDVREELQPAASPIQAAAPAAPAATAVDPFDTVAKIMGMRSNDPMITLLLSRMEAQDKAMEQARQREYDLQKELRQSQTVQQTAAAPKTLIEQLKELGELKGLMSTVFGAGQTAEATVRPGKLGWLDFAREVLPEIVNSPIITSLASRVAAPAQPLPQFNPAPQAQAPPSTADTLTFVQTVVTPAMLQHFEREQVGGDFAAWLYDGHPERLSELQGYGEQRIFELYKRHAPRPDWAILTARGEPAFAKFIHEFCAWTPEPDEEEAQPAPVGASGIVYTDEDDDKEKES